MLAIDTQFGATYHAEIPEEAVVDNHPALLSESGQLLALCDAIELSQWSKKELHGTSAQSSEENDAEEDEVDIVNANAILAALGVVVAKLEELVCMRPCLGNECVCKKQ